MNATLKQTLFPSDDPVMKSAFITSGLFHVIIFTLAVVGIPYVAKDTPTTMMTSISVELVDVSDITTTTRVAPKREEKEPDIEKPEPPKATDMPRNTAETPPDLTTPKPPEPVEKPEPEAKKPEPVQEVAEEKPTPKPKPEPPKETAKDEPKQNDFQSILKNIIPDEGTTKNEETTENDVEPASGDMAQLADKLTMSELDAFKHQLSPCWNIPAGAEYAENLAVEVRVLMNRDMTMKSADVINKARYNSDPTFRAAADSALRALRNPRCSPFKLPPEKYDEWKSIVINFNPKDML